MRQPRGLLLNGADPFGVGIAEGVHPYSAAKINIGFALTVKNHRAPAAGNRDVKSRVSRHKALAFGKSNLIEIHLTTLSARPETRSIL